MKMILYRRLQLLVEQAKVEELDKTHFRYRL
jgi:hypothetical protein